MLIPRGLLAADLARLPEEEVDVLIVGSGVAGLSAALAVPAGRTVLLATKDRLGHSATRYAQGGIAAVLDLGGSPAEGPDSVAEHVADTLAAGAGLCDPAAVRMLAAEGAQAIADLRARGVRFDRAGLDGELARTREGEHSWARVVHAGGDATGAELGRALTEAVRAGAVLADLEFVQFHPTALHVDGDPRPLISEAMRGEGAVLRDGNGTPVMAGVHPLGDLAPRDVVTRAMAARMAATGAHHLWLDATSIPADHLERRFPTILARCRAAGIDPTRQPVPVSPAAHYLMGGVVTDLDGRTSLPGLFAVGETACTGVHGANRLASNSLLEGVVFAARIGRALAAGAEAEPGAGVGMRSGGEASAVDNPTRPVPGWATLPEGAPPPTGLGEARPPMGLGAARPGPLREGPPPVGPGLDGLGAMPMEVRGRLRRLMTDRVGVVRSGKGLAEAVGELERMTVDLRDPGPGGFEAGNLVQLGRAVAELALRREESRGGHWRSDHPAPVEAWRIRQTLTRTAEGDLDPGLLAVATAEEVRR